MSYEKQIQNEFISIYQNNRQDFYSNLNAYHNLLKIARIKDYIKLMKDTVKVEENSIIENILSSKESEFRRNINLSEE